MNTEAQSRGLAEKSSEEPDWVWAGRNCQDPGQRGRLHAPAGRGRGHRELPAGGALGLPRGRRGTGSAGSARALRQRGTGGACGPGPGVGGRRRAPRAPESACQARPGSREGGTSPGGGTPRRSSAPSGLARPGHWLGLAAGGDPAGSSGAAGAAPVASEVHVDAPVSPASAPPGWRVWSPPGQRGVPGPGRAGWVPAPLCSRGARPSPRSAASVRGARSRRPWL